MVDKTEDVETLDDVYMPPEKSLLIQRFETLCAARPALRAATQFYMTAMARHSSEGLIDALRDGMDTAMRNEGLSYIERVEIRRELHEELRAKRQEDTRRVLRKQVEERHLGR